MQPPLRDPRRDEVHLIQQQDHVLVALHRVLPEVVLQVRAPSAHRIPRVQNLDDHVARIHDFVQLAPDALGLALLEQAPARGVRDAVGDANEVLVVHDARLDALAVRLGGGGGGERHGREGIGRELGALLPPTGAEGLREGALAEEVHAPSAASLRVGEEAQRELLLLDDDGVPVLGLGRHVLAELLELLLADDARVPEPPAVGDDARARELLALEVLLDELALLVPRRLLLVHQQAPDRRRRALALRALAAALRGHGMPGLLRPAGGDPAGGLRPAGGGARLLAHRGARERGRRERRGAARECAAEREREGGHGKEPARGADGGRRRRDR